MLDDFPATVPEGNFGCIDASAPIIWPDSLVIHRDCLLKIPMTYRQVHRRLYVTGAGAADLARQTAGSTRYPGRICDLGSIEDRWRLCKNIRLEGNAENSG